MLDIDYARRGDLSIAYQVVGDGPLDIIFGAGLVSHLDLMWCDPHATAFLRRLGQFGRLILFDKPGTGLSDPVLGMPTVEQRSQDFLTVLDAVGSKRAAVIGYSEAAPPAALLAASHPDRVEALVLLSGFARSVANAEWLPELEDYCEDVWWKMAWHCADHWGDGTMPMVLSPWIRESPVYRRLAPSLERASASPGMARSIITAMRDYDVLPALDSIATPTVVIHRSDEFIPIECGRDLAHRIAGAKLTELPGNEHIHFFNGEDVTDAIGDFLGRSRPSNRAVGRALTTVLFTDIVDSTSRAATLGDEQWGELLEHHDRITSEEIERHGGRLVKQLGDGALATFDRPLMSIRCAKAVVSRMNELGLEIRAGIHTGECELVGDDVAGIAVHIGARIASLAATCEVLVTSTVRDLVLGSGVQFADHGVHELKGVPGEWQVCAVEADASADQRPVPGGVREPAATATMTRLDKTLVTLASRTPWLTRPALRAAGRIRSRPKEAG